jgi:MoaA/NifB/PqqE/SkfB family radical SAM enzyme
MRVQINTVVMRETVDGLPDMVKLLLDLGIRTWEVFYYIPVGRAGKESDLSPQEYEDVSRFLYEASKYGIVTRTVEGPFFRRVGLISKIAEEKGLPYPFKTGDLYERLVSRLRELLGEPRGPPKAHTVGTMDARGIIFISYNGNVYPSGFLLSQQETLESKALLTYIGEARCSQLYAIRSKDAVQNANSKESAEEAGREHTLTIMTPLPRILRAFTRQVACQNIT